MIKISDTHYLAAAAVKSIRKRDNSDYVNVETFDGALHSVPADYGKSIYDKLDELVTAVRKATEPRP